MLVYIGSEFSRLHSGGVNTLFKYCGKSIDGRKADRSRYYYIQSPGTRPVNG